MSDKTSPQPTEAPTPLAKPGPHPAEADDARKLGGSDPDLPEGVEPSSGSEGDDEPETV